MMNNRSIGLMVIAILAMGLVIYLHQASNRPEVDVQIGSLVFPELKGKLNAIQEVKLTSGGQTTTIDHKGNNWSIAQKGGYEADFAKLTGFLDGLAKAKYLERKTSRPENFGELGLTGVDDSSSKATEVVINTSDGSVYELLIGHKSEGEHGYFVRKPSESQAWLVDHVTAANSDPLHWIEPVVFSIEGDEVASVTDASADGKKVLTVKRSADSDNFTIENLPKGAKLKYETVADTLSRALVNVRATDVRARGEEPWKDATTSDFKLKDGSEIVVRGMQDSNGQRWLRFDLTAAKKPSEAVSFIDASRLEDFEFKVPDYTFEQFTKTMDDMIKKEEPEASNKKAAPAAGS